MEATIESINRLFPDKAACIHFLMEIRWPDKVPVNCPFCHSYNIHYNVKSYRYHCNKCKKITSATAGTLFHRTQIPLQIWFVAILRVCFHKKPIKARALAREMGIHRYTAGKMLNCIRSAIHRHDKLIIQLFNTLQCRLSR